MAVDVRTHKLLWGYANNRCAFPGCGQHLLVPTSEGDDDITFGKEAHIVASKADGPRGPNTLSPADLDKWRHLVDDRDGFDNLLLLCGVHHDQVDQDVKAFPIEVLVEMRSEQLRVGQEGQSQPARQAIASEVRIAAIVDGWAERVDLDMFSNRLGQISYASRLDETWLDDLEGCVHWLFNRVWPDGFAPLQESLTNFRVIAQDLIAVASHYGERSRGHLVIDRAYKEPRAHQSAETHEFLLERHHYSIGLCRDLAFELTRAANLVCERVRSTLWPSFRIDEGNLTFQAGLTLDLTEPIYLPLYANGGADGLYPGLQEFASSRNEGEDFGFGLPPQGCSYPGLE